MKFNYVINTLAIIFAGLSTGLAIRDKDWGEMLAWICVIIWIFNCWMAEKRCE